MSRLGLPSEYDYWLSEYSPIIPQKSNTTDVYIVQYYFRRVVKARTYLKKYQLIFVWIYFFPSSDNPAENGEI